MMTVGFFEAMSTDLTLASLYLVCFSVTETSTPTYNNNNNNNNNNVLTYLQLRAINKMSLD
jgi:hypothetical protein